MPLVSQNLCQGEACDPHSLPNPGEGLWHLFPASSKNLIGIRWLFPFLFFFPFQQVQGLFCRLVTLDRFIVMSSWQVGLMLFLQSALRILFLFIFSLQSGALCSSSFKEVMGLLPLLSFFLSGIAAGRANSQGHPPSTTTSTSPKYT